METKRTHCCVCHRTFNSYRNRLKHEQVCKDSKNKIVYQQDYVCKHCNATFSTAWQLKSHNDNIKHSPTEDVRSTSDVISTTDTKRCKRRKEQHEESPLKKRKVENRFICCRQCNEFKGTTHKELYAHRAEKHSQRDEILSTFQPTPFNTQTPLWQNEDGTIDQELQSAYRQHKQLILKQKKTILTTASRYNFPTTNEITLSQLKEHIEEIYEDNSFSFKINLSFGIILRHISYWTMSLFCAIFK